MTQKIEQSQRQERVAAWNRRAECDLAAFQNSPKQTYQAEKSARSQTVRQPGRSDSSLWFTGRHDGFLPSRFPWR
nr:citrate lyase alpha chain [uncultured bacterium]